MFCRNCGTELNSDTRFCPSCGTKAETEIQQPAAAPIAEEPAACQEPAVAPVEANATPIQAPVAAPVATDTTVVQQPTVDPGKGMGTAALVLGIVSLSVGILCSCLFACLGGFIPLVCGILGIVFGVKASNTSKAAGFENKSAKVGLILSIIGIVMIVIFIIANAIIGSMISWEEFNTDYTYY